MIAGTEKSMAGDQNNSTRADYSLVVRIATRWNDYDMLGHINNVEYYRFFETTLLTLLTRAGLDWRVDSVIPFAVENHCNFRRPLTPANHLDGCIRIGQVGHSSVTYELALFMLVDENPSAHGYFVHVFVDRITQRPVEIPKTIRASFDVHRTRLVRSDPEYVTGPSLFPSVTRSQATPS